MTAPGTIVVDIGGTNLRLGLVDPFGEGKVLSTVSARSLAENPVAVLAGLIAGLIAALPAKPGGIVIGVPGPLDATRRRVIDAPNIPSLRGLPLAGDLAEACGLPVWLEHDGALLLRGEHASGAAAGHDLVLGVFFGTGIAAAFLSHGRPQKGGDFSMQLGHVPVRGDGRPCCCGGVDCLEAYASGLVLDGLASRHGVAIGRLFADRRFDPGLDTALRAFVDHQAIAVATAITLLDPDITVMGGGVIDMADYPLDELFQATRRRLSPIFDPPRKRLARATLGWQAVFSGALAVVKERLADRREIQSGKAAWRTRRPGD